MRFFQLLTVGEGEGEGGIAREITTPTVRPSRNSGNCQRCLHAFEERSFPANPAPTSSRLQLPLSRDSARKEARRRTRRENQGGKKTGEKKSVAVRRERGKTRFDDVAEHVEHQREE